MSVRHRAATAGEVQLDLFPGELPVMDRLVYQQRVLAADERGWLAAYWAAAPVRRGRFKAMRSAGSARVGRGFRQDVPVTRPVCLPGKTR